MSVSPIGVPVKPYQGILASQAFKRWGQSGNLVKAKINWNTDYGAGDNLPALCVIVTFQPFAVGTVQQDFKPLSVYINNLGNSLPIYVWFPDTEYEIVCPPNSEGWFAAVTNSTIAWVFGLNFQTTFPASSTIFFSDLLIPNYVNVAIPQNVENWISSLNIGSGGGANVVTIVPIAPGGVGYANGNLSISGGGGTGATAQGTLNQFGSFTSVIVTNPGNDDYTGSPLVTATASNTVAGFVIGATYAPNQLFTTGGTVWGWFPSGGAAGTSIQTGAPGWAGGVYGAGAQVNYSGNIYANLTGGNLGSSTPPPNDGRWTFLGPATPANNVGGWMDSGIIAGTTATFQTTLSAPTAPSSAQSSGYAPPALGDQNYSRVATISAAGVILDNIFKSPFGSGFIYLTNLAWFCLLGSAAATANVELAASDGTVAVGQIALVSAAANSQPGKQGELRGNVRLAATKQWQIKCVSFSGPGTLTANFMHTFTYSQF